MNKLVMMMMGTLCLAVGAQDHAVGKKVTRLGVATVMASDEIRDQLDLPIGVGLTVRDVSAGSPAAKAGIKSNDVLTKLDDQWLMDMRQLRNLVVARKTGDEVKLTYIRKGKPATVSAVLDAQEQDATTEGALRLGSFTIDLNEMMGKVSGIGKEGSMKVIAIGPDGVSGNMGGAEVGAKLTEVLNQVIGGTGSNVSVTVKSSLIGGSNMTDSDATKITTEVARALKEAGVHNEKVSTEVRKAIEATLKEHKDGTARQ